MRVHHLNCGTMCPAGGRLFDGSSDGATGRIVCHCLVIETDAGLVLVDTGLGMRDVTAPAERLSPFFRALCNPQLRREETMVQQLRALGFRPDDVRHIIVTHLDFDHAGGLEDFPLARVHVTDTEKRAADAQRGGRGIGNMVGHGRYRPQQWDEISDWRLYPMGGGEPWHGFAAVRDLDGLPPEILLVPLPGHTFGHSGVAVDTGAGWLLHAGDAYFHRGEIGGTYHCPPGMILYQQLMEADRTARLANQARLRDLAATATDVRIISGHDAVEWEILAG